MNYHKDFDIDFIIKQISESGITSDELKEDLIDHFCCVIEDEMNKGKKFKDSYETAYNNICPNGFEDIQKETVYLLTSKTTKNMKKTLLLFGIILLTSVITGMFLKLMHWPGANVILGLSALALVIGFVPMLFLFLYRNDLNKVFSDKLKHILGYIGFSILILGIMFKLLHWPGAGIMLGVSVLILNFGYFPLLIFKIYRKKVN